MFSFVKKYMTMCLYEYTLKQLQKNISCIKKIARTYCVVYVNVNGLISSRRSETDKVPYKNWIWIDELRSWK